MKTILLSLAISTALAACGGGGTGDPSGGPAQACTPRQVSVALLGDSTQWGQDGFTGRRAIPNPGDLLQSAMDGEFGPGAVIVTDYGVGGTTADQAPIVAADVTVENYGINDEDYGHAVAQYHADVAAIGATIIETPIPTLRQPLDVLTAYAQAARQPGIPTADVFGYVLSLPDWQAYVSPDKTHPSAALYALIVQNVLAPAVAAQVAPMRCE